MKNKIMKNTIMSLVMCASIFGVSSNFSVTANAESWYRNGTDLHHFDDNGVMEIGWYCDNDKNYYFFNENGKMQTGWYYDGANWYCFNENGTRITGQYYYNNVWYNFNQDGTMVLG